MTQSQIEGILTRIRDDQNLYNSSQYPIRDEVIDSFSMPDCPFYVFSNIASLFNYYAQFDAELQSVMSDNGITDENGWRQLIEEAYKKGRTQDNPEPSVPENEGPEQPTPPSGPEGGDDDSGDSDPVSVDDEEERDGPEHPGPGGSSSSGDSEPGNNGSSDEQNENENTEEQTALREIEKVEQKFNSLGSEIEKYFSDLLNNPDLTDEERQKITAANVNDEARRAYLEDKIKNNNNDDELQKIEEEIQKIDEEIEKKKDTSDLENSLDSYIQDIELESNNRLESNSYGQALIFLELNKTNLNLTSEQISNLSVNECIGKVGNLIEEAKKQPNMDSLQIMKLENFRLDLRKAKFSEDTINEMKETYLQVSQLDELKALCENKPLSLENLEKIENGLDSITRQNSNKEENSIEKAWNLIVQNKESLNFSDDKIKNMNYAQLLTALSELKKNPSVEVDDDLIYECRKNFDNSDLQALKNRINRTENIEKLKSDIKTKKDELQEISELENKKAELEAKKNNLSSSNGKSDEYQSMIDKIDRKKGYGEVLNAYNGLVQEIPGLVDSELDHLISEGIINADALEKSDYMQVNLINKFLAENDKFQAIRNSEVLKNDKDILKLKLKNELVQDIKAKLKDRAKAKNDDDEKTNDDDKTQQKAASRYQWLGKLASCGLGVVAGIGLGAVTASVPAVGVALTAYSVGRAAYAAGKFASNVITHFTGKEPKVVTKIKDSKLGKFAQKLFEKPKESEHPYLHWFFNGVSIGYLADRLFDIHSKIDFSRNKPTPTPTPPDNPTPDQVTPDNTPEPVTPDPVVPDPVVPADYSSLTEGMREPGGKAYHLISSIVKKGGNIDMDVDPVMKNGKMWYHLLDKTGAPMCWQTADKVKDYVGQEEFEAAKKIFEGTVGKSR